MSLKVKFIFIISIVFGILIGSQFYFYKQKRTIDNSMHRVVVSHGKAIDDLNELSKVLHTCEVEVYQKLLNKSVTSVDAKKALSNNINTRISVLNRSLAEYAKSWEKDEQDLLRELFIDIDNKVLSKEIKLLESEYVTDGDLKYLKDNNKRALAKITSLIDRLKNMNKFLLEKTNAMSDDTHSTLLILNLIIILLVLAIYGGIHLKFFIPLRKLSIQLLQMSRGNISLDKQKTNEKELNLVYNNLKALSDRLLEVTAFSDQLSKNNYKSEFEPASGTDELGNSLIELRNNLETATNEAEERRKNDQIQNWTTQGMAKFGEILRQNEENIKNLGQTIITNLVKYMNINQGGIFVQNVDDFNKETLDLVAVYAYDREKFAQKQILPGEGLVGTCYSEKETIYMTDVPSGYVNITSGLGEATPTCILIVPLKKEDGVLGVIELGSFHALEEHEVAFVEKIAESIAATLSNVRITEQTSGLLGQLQEQTEMMKSQEEEMRQNLEEMQATQEEAERNRELLEQELEVTQTELNELREELMMKDDHGEDE